METTQASLLVKKRVLVAWQMKEMHSTDKFPAAKELPA